MPKYKVKISKVSNMYQLVQADNPRRAKEAVWTELSLAGNWGFKWKDKAEFMEHAEVEKV